MRDSSGRGAVSALALWRERQGNKAVIFGASGAKVWAKRAAAVRSSRCPSAFTPGVALSPGT